MRVICYLEIYPVKCPWYQDFPDTEPMMARSALIEHISSHRGEELLLTYESYYRKVMALRK